MAKKIALITGELSGSFYADLLFHAIREIDSNTDIRGTGGSFPELVEMRDVAVVGILSAVARLPRFWRLFRRLKRAILDWSPDVLVLLDFPDFNLFLGRSLVKQGVRFPILYFSPPTIWAWRSKRAEVVKKVCNQVFTLFEFEAEVYRRYGVDAVWEGHPLIDVISRKLTRTVEKRNGVVVGLLPGSRRTEIERHLPVLVESAKWIYNKCVKCKFLLSLLDRRFEWMIDKALPLRVVEDVHGLMLASDFLIGASGTVTVEAAIFGKPMVVIYKSSMLDKFIYDYFVHTRFVAMPNIVLQKEVYPELLQEKATPSAISQVVLKWIGNPETAENIKKDIELFRSQLGSEGVMDRIAKRILGWAG